MSPFLLDRQLKFELEKFLYMIGHGKYFIINIIIKNKNFKYFIVIIKCLSSTSTNNLPKPAVTNRK